MLTIAIVGNFNVGKTSLFNFLTNTNFSFSNNYKYFTLDYNYGFLDYNYIKFNNNIILIDTNSIEKKVFKKNKNNNNILLHFKKKFLYLIKNVNFIFFLVDSHIITDKDKYLSRYLFKFNKNIILLLTKKDLNINSILNKKYFYCLKVNNIYYISIYDKYSIYKLLNDLLNKKKIENKNLNFYISNINYCVNLDKNYYIHKKYLLNNKNNIYNYKIIKFIILGKDNVGKSSLLNLFCNKYRSVISNVSGCTKDFIMSLYKYNSNFYYLISDSPGLCKNKYYYNEIISIVNLNFKIILYVIDINLNISKFDLNILNFFFKKGKYILLLFNKCDNVNNNFLKIYKNNLIKKYDFMKYINIYFLSCINCNFNILNKLFKDIYLNYINIFLNCLDNFKVNCILKKFNKNQNNLIFNLKYAFIYKYYPLIIWICGNKINMINNSYKKYLLNFYMNQLNYKGFKIFLKFKEIYNNCKN